MTIKELKKILEQFNEDSEVTIFCEETSTLYEIDSISNNNGNIQINIGE